MPKLAVWLAATILSTASAALAQSPPPIGEWPVVGGNDAWQKYSPLDQIDRTNVSRLTRAWSWETGDAPIPGPRLPVPGQAVRPGDFQTTPIVVDGTMYLSTPYNRVAALDALTGEARWDYDPRTVEWGQPPNGTGFVHRGIALWRDGADRRIFLNTRWRLIALDADTGEPIPSFGSRGEIDLTEHLIWPTNRLHYTQTSPPVLYRDLVILGNGVWDGFVYGQDPPGNIQAFDVRTGELAWRFNLIPQAGEFGNDTWEDEAWRHTGHTNAWAPMSVDRARGLLYVPVGTPSNDYYGGHRHGDNLFAESLLCLDAATGERVWHFQAVRHGLWDWDLGSPPALLTIEVDGRTIDAVAAPSKLGFVYVFDRATGEPVWPIEDREVPESDVPGERTSPTQPFPTKPAPFARQGLRDDDLIDFTPALRAEALALVGQYRYGPMFLPPSEQGSISLPGNIGGANWGGAAVDPTTGIIYVKASNSPSLLAIAEADPNRIEGDYAVDRSRRRLRLDNGLPILKPPYGTLTAIDLNTGRHRWQVPMGDSPAIRAHAALAGVALPARLGVVGHAGPIATASGLLFITGGGNVLYAFDADTGEELWAADLGARSNANPMTYLGHDGRQYVAVAVGRGAGTHLVAFALAR